MDGDRVYYHPAYYNRAYRERNGYWHRHERPEYRKPDSIGSVDLLIKVLVDLIVRPILWALRFYTEVAAFVCLLFSILYNTFAFFTSVLYGVLNVLILMPIHFAKRVWQLYLLWISLCALVHFVDWSQDAHGLLARQVFDFLSLNGTFWAVHVGRFAPYLRYLRLVGDVFYPFGVFWTVVFPSVLDDM